MTFVDTFAAFILFGCSGLLLMFGADVEDRFTRLGFLAAAGLAALIASALGVRGCL